MTEVSVIFCHFLSEFVAYLFLFHSFVVICMYTSPSVIACYTTRKSLAITVLPSVYHHQIDMEREPSLLFDVLYSVDENQPGPSTGYLIYTNGAVYRYETNESSLLVSKRQRRQSGLPCRRLSPQVIDELRALLLLQPDRDRGDTTTTTNEPSRLISLLRIVLQPEDTLRCTRCQKCGANALDTADHQVYCEEPCEEKARVAPRDVPVMMMRPDSGRVRRGTHTRDEDM